MTNREKLHNLVDELSEPDVDEALQYITWQQENGFANLLHEVPPEPFSTATAAELSEGFAQAEESTASVIFLNDAKRT
ncbi:MAG TPA: hypothetical protein VIC05_06875 [Solirubrobacteraceae bacterium]|jgi:hypothetical protein